jgi:pteridine reductase
MLGEQPLAGRCVLITGAARRLGAAMARALHGAGANIVIHHRASADAAFALMAELNARRSGSAHTVAADLLNVNALPELVASAVACCGRLDVLINNASTFYPTPVGEITLAQFDDLIGTNLRAPVFLAQAAAPALRASQGLIINMVDIHGQRPLKAHPVYSSAKAGLLMLTRALARDLGPAIRVNGIAPGPVMWPEQPMDAALQTEIIGKTALKRNGSAADVAQTALFLAAHAPYITGQVIAVDGGRSI